MVHPGRGAGFRAVLRHPCRGAIAARCESGDVALCAQPPAICRNAFGVCSSIQRAPRGQSSVAAQSKSGAFVSALQTVSLSAFVHNPPRMTGFYWAMAFGLGAIVGSFLNVVIHRYPREESIVFP